MDTIHYMISDAAQLVNVESHVLRYWEEELDLHIGRNELGHRFYTRENIKEFQKIKSLKDQGYQLKAIKKLLQDETYALDPDPLQVLTAEEKYAQFREMLTEIVGHAIAMNNEELCESISTEVKDTVIKEMNYLLQEQEEAANQRFQRLDELLRKKSSRDFSREDQKMTHKMKRLFSKIAEI